jgi:hypothetical protein
MTVVSLIVVQLLLLSWVLIYQFRLNTKIGTLEASLEDLLESQREASVDAERDLNRRLSEIQTMRFSGKVLK